MALGHVRYSTTGANSWENSQPVYRADKREVALGHNGNLVNVVELHQELRDKGVSFRSTSDSEIIAALRLHARRADGRRGARGRHQARRGRLQHGRDDRRPRRRLPRSDGPAPALAGDARRQLLRRERDLRVRHHRRQVPPRRAAGRDHLDHQEGDRDAPGRAVAAQRAVRLRAHLLRPPGLAAGRPGDPGLARQDGRDPGQGGAGRGRPRDPGAGLRQPRRARLRARVRPPAGRRADQEPLRRPHLHPARPGTAQARPAAEVQPAPRSRRRQAHRRRRRLDRARQHDAPDRADAARRRGQRSAHAHLRAADPPSLSLRDRHVDARGDDRPQPHPGRGGRGAGRRLARLPVTRRRVRGDQRLARDALRRLLLGRSTRSSARPTKDAFEHALPLVRT